MSEMFRSEPGDTAVIDQLRAYGDWLEAERPGESGWLSATDPVDWGCSVVHRGDALSSLGGSPALSTRSAIRWRILAWAAASACLVGAWAMLRADTTAVIVEPADSAREWSVISTSIRPDGRPYVQPASGSGLASLVAGGWEATASAWVGDAPTVMAIFAPVALDGDLDVDSAEDLVVVERLESEPTDIEFGDDGRADGANFFGVRPAPDGGVYLVIAHAASDRELFMAALANGNLESLSAPGFVELERSARPDAEGEWTSFHVGVAGEEDVVVDLGQAEMLIGTQAYGRRPLRSAVEDGVPGWWVDLDVPNQPEWRVLVWSVAPGWRVSVGGTSDEAVLRVARSLRFTDNGAWGTDLPPGLGGIED